MATRATEISSRAEPFLRAERRLIRRADTSKIGFDPLHASEPVPSRPLAVTVDPDALSLTVSRLIFIV
jgi:hypothetical protein